MHVRLSPFTRDPWQFFVIVLLLGTAIVLMMVMVVMMAMMVLAKRMTMTFHRPGISEKWTLRCAGRFRHVK